MDNCNITVRNANATVVQRLRGLEHWPTNMPLIILCLVNIAGTTCI